MTTSNPTNQPIQANPIQRDAVILYLSVGRLRTKRKLNSDAVQSDIAPDMLHVSKEILQSEELKAVSQFDNEVRHWVRARALPSPFSKKGLMLLPVRLIEPVMAQLDRKQVERLELIEAFMKAYDRCKEEAQGKLGSAFNEGDYPSEEAVRRTFFFECQMWELSAPGKLKSVSKELYQRELAKMNNMWSEASKTVTNVLLEEFRKMTAHMVERLTPSGDGKTKVFRDSVVTNMLEWMDLFKSRNLTNDVQLVDVVDRAKELISGIDAEALRDSKGLRHKLATDFQGLTDRLDEAIINAPIRAIDFDLEDAAV
jgi:hypothetical protein